MNGSDAPVPGDERWMLPDGIEELLPPAAARLEKLRRDLLDLYRGWGYELVIPPLIEYTDSLLIGLGRDVELQTFKLTDQLSGRTLGVRPDITPQTARIDAHSLRREGPVRLCYAGSVLHTRPRSPFASRAPIETGAELYGEPSLAADIEIISLMLEGLACAGQHAVTLDLGHVGIFRALVQDLALAPDLAEGLFAALQEKSAGAVENLLSQAELAPEAKRLLRGLLDLHGDAGVLEQAGALFEACGQVVLGAIASLGEVATTLHARFPRVRLHFDLCELHGYHYHTGLVFAAYVDGHGEAVANGGRYDDIGKVFGRPRPATGFTTDLKTLLALQGECAPVVGGIFVPCESSAAAWPEIRRLRALGERVVVGLPRQSVSGCCDRLLRAVDGDWQVETL